MTMPTRSRRKPSATVRARALRQGGNIAEARLWNELKDRKLGGFKFVRQLPIGPFFADFACREAHLVVEVDGRQHADRASDKARDIFMQREGYSVLRFWNTDIFGNLGPVCETILATLHGRLSEDIVASDLRYVKSK
ncbi:MAG: endonuclease domain-containing protein [Mesorhizobium sp.]